jgi:hypothetical protein
MPGRYGQSPTTCLGFVNNPSRWGNAAVRRTVETLHQTKEEGLIMPQTQIGETDHFWCRLQPEGVYIDSQRDNKAFGYADGRLVLSEDDGRTWPHSLTFPNAHKLTFSCILKNGNIVFATRS